VGRVRVKTEQAGADDVGIEIQTGKLLTTESTESTEKTCTGASQDAPLEGAFQKVSTLAKLSSPHK
jgi:hypothetical protein